MENQRQKFKDWMLQRKTTKKDGNTYTIKTVNKCTTTLNTALNKFGISYLPDKNNTIFCCDNYSDFLALDLQIRNHPDFDYLDGPGKGQRWVHNGLLLYGYYLLDKEETPEEERADALNSIVTGHNSDGKKIQYYTTRYERKKENREAAIAIHGLKCQCCGFDFQEKYGELGNGFIEVHHLVPLSSLDEEVAIDAKTDLACLCSNCHRMIHRKRNDIITIETLKSIIND